MRRAPPRRERQTAVLVEDADGRVLLRRRPAEEAQMPGLWELPTVASRGPRRAATALAARFGGSWRLAAPVGGVRHSITVRSLDIELRRGEWRADGVGEASELAWVARDRLGALALSGATRKLLRERDEVGVD